jgi:hypothetical protein
LTFHFKNSKTFCSTQYHKEALLDASKEIGLEVNSEKPSIGENGLKNEVRTSGY